MHLGHLYLLPTDPAQGQMNVTIVNKDPIDILEGICVSCVPRTGSEAYQILEEKFGVVAELSTQQVVVFAFGSGSQMKDAEELVSAMKRMADTARRTEVSEISRSACVVDEDLCRMAEGLQLPVIEMAPREAFYHQKVRWGTICVRQSPAWFYMISYMP